MKRKELSYNKNLQGRKHTNCRSLFLQQWQLAFKSKFFCPPNMHATCIHDLRRFMGCTMYEPGSEDPQKAQCSTSFADEHFAQVQLEPVVFKSVSAFDQPNQPTRYCSSSKATYVVNTNFTLEANQQLQVCARLRCTHCAMTVAHLTVQNG